MALGHFGVRGLACSYRQPPAELEVRRAKRNMQRSGITIRKAQQEDIERLVPLIRQLCEEEGKHSAAIRVPKLVELFAMPGLHLEALVAEAGSVLVGYLAFYGVVSLFKCNSVLLVENMYVLPDYRKHGVGRMLMGTVAAEALARGWDRIELNVRDDNGRACRFYERMGFQAVQESVRRVEGERLRLLGEPYIQL